MQEEMKVQHLASGFWEQENSSSLSTSSSSSSNSSSSSLTLNPKRLRPLAPKLASSSSSPCTAAASGSSEMTITSLTLSSSTKAITKCISRSQLDQYSYLMESTQTGATRWNPTPEQIKVLETLYRGGTLTPNANQIEHITSELGKYGRIEGKNVFYWFQNHKARERQKQKRSSALLTLSSNPNLASLSDLKVHLQQEEEEGEEEEEEKEEKMKLRSNNWNCKRKCRGWWGISDCHDQMELQEINGNKKSDCCSTLELFPLHPDQKERKENRL